MRWQRGGNIEWCPEMRMSPTEKETKQQQQKSRKNRLCVCMPQARQCVTESGDGSERRRRLDGAAKRPNTKSKKKLFVYIWSDAMCMAAASAGWWWVGVVFDLLVGLQPTCCLNDVPIFVFASIPIQIRTHTNAHTHTSKWHWHKHQPLICLRFSNELINDFVFGWQACVHVGVCERLCMSHNVGTTIYFYHVKRTYRIV